MSVSRRQFLRTSAITASVPLVTTLSIDSSEARIGDAVDLSLGYKPGAIFKELKTLL
jgi:hypothetical protein